MKGNTMLAGCPKCSARYRVDAERIGPDGAKLRCTKCSAVFLVRAPKSGATPAAVPEAPVAAAATAPSDPPQTPPDAEIDSTKLVIVADSDEARGKHTCEAVEGWGLIPLLVNDGVEAMLVIQRRLPVAVILDAALPKMFGFQVCEVIKRNESLRHTTVVLIGAIHHQDRYRRNPSELYGADQYVESPDVPDALLPIFRDAGLPLGAGAPAAATTQSPVTTPEPAIDPSASGTTLSPPTPEPAATPEPDLAFESPPPTPEPVAAPAAPPTPAAVAAPAAPAPADEDPERTAERERAQRLARIAVSEMVLYQPEKFDQATRDGTLEKSLDLEIQEARALLRQRISEEVRAEADFIIEELNRVAADRGGQA